jgi:hypothetical protein
MKIARPWLITACLAVTVTAACSSARTTPITSPTGGDPASSATSPLLCRTAAQVDHLVVYRIDAFAQNHIRFSFPAVVTVGGAASTRDVEEALCALPKMPNATISCPADFGITYRLRFFAADRAFPTVDVEVSGCETVDGLGATRWVETTQGFWRELGTAMGLTNPDQQTFAGTFPNV